MKVFALFTALALATHAPLAAATGSCAYYAMDFSGVTRGTYITDDFEAGFGLTVSCYDSGANNGCRIFDTAVPWGEWTGTGYDCDCVMDGCSSYQKGVCGDPDLGAPNNQCGGPGGNGGPGHSSGNNAGGPDDAYPNCEPRGNVLIIDENGPNNPPDDRSSGGTMTFNFLYAADLDEICFLDVDAAEQTKVHVWFENGDPTLYNIPAPVVGDNGYGCLSLPYQGVNKVKVLMDGSGSVSDLKYNMCNPNHGGGGGGDPHIKRWNRKHFSFHGECDLVMLHSDEFHKFTGLDLHVRTTVQDWYSYIEMAALRVGDYVMEVHSQYLTLDGIEYTDHDLPLSFGGDFKYVINAPEVEEDTKFHGAKVYRVDLHDESWINFKVYKEFVFIEVSGHEEDFSDAMGLLGDYYNGNMVDRQGQRVYDYDQFGFEWQVRPGVDANLFSTVREPQFPRQCNMPSVQRSSRRLRANNGSLFTDAKSACAKAADINLCVDDVLATGDLGMATMW